jgi:heme exporter protein A
MTITLELDGLTAVRGGRVLFENLSFAAGAGAFVELRGANGAGKTSLLRIIAGYLKPRTGVVRLPGAEEPSLILHYLGHQNALKGACSVREHARYWAGLLGGDAGDAIERVGLERQAALPARVLSQGQARRLALARLLAAPRPLWLLDEPAAALDQDGRMLLAALIEAHRREGGIVIAALHESLGPTPSQTVTIAADRGRDH